MAKVRAVLEELRRHEQWASNITAWRVLPERPGRYVSMPTGLHPDLVHFLSAQGIDQLYTHQAVSVSRALEGHHVMVVTPTASGKTLCYNLPVLDRLLHEGRGNALYLFPTKALAHDQLEVIESALKALEIDVLAASYDGDTTHGKRALVRRAARHKPVILATNPDMLHVGILPYHTQWREFFANLSYVVLDEVHTYRGVFGSHVANVMRRLVRIARFYGSHPRFICTSATIANPLQLVRQLVDAPACLVEESGAPQGERVMIFHNPPLVDQRLGLRNSPLDEARMLANRFLDRSLQTVLFALSRRAVEQLVIALRQDATRAGRDPGEIRGYRGGYLPRERREIEAGLRDGSVRAVVATNALELGVDIGGLAACIMVGYPGTIASTWQRAGRAGRTTDASVAVLIASSSPSDQYIVTHPNYFFSGNLERALVNPDNLYVLLQHVQCAAWELPFDEKELFGGEDLQEMLAFLDETGQVRHSGGRWHWTGEQFPAAETSLRAASPNSVSIVALGRTETSAPPTRTVIGQVDRESAATWVHENAIYLHEGQQYLVERFDWDECVAEVRPVWVDYFTQATQSTRISIEAVSNQAPCGVVCLYQGEIKLTTKATGYRKLRLGTMEHIGWGEIDLPEQVMLTSACWMTIAEEIVERLKEEGWWVGDHSGQRGPNWARQRDLARQRDGQRCRWCGAEERAGRQHQVHHITPFRQFGWTAGENETYRAANDLSNLITLCPSCHRRAEQQVAVRGTLASLSRVIGHVIPLLFMCDRHDIGLQSDVRSSQTGLPTLFIYDAIPGGVGLSDEVPAAYETILEHASDLVRDCPCESGCPSCIGASTGAEPRAKQQVLRLIQAIQSEPVSDGAVAHKRGLV